MKCQRNGRGPFLVREIRFPHNMNILCCFENWIRLDGECHALAISVGSGRVEVEEVLVERVVRGLEQTEDPTRIAAGPGNDVGDGGRGRGGLGGVVDDAVLGLVGRVEERVGPGMWAGGGGGRGGGEGEDEGYGEE